ncbi:MAG: electron transport complex protein RnfA [Anaerovoracaceae bacterium]
MKEMMIIIVSVVLVDNLVLSKFLGICPFLGVSKKLDSAVGMSFAVTFVMVLATAATYPIYMGLLARFKIEYMQTIVFILVIASLVQLVEITLKKYSPGMHKSLGVYLPLITTNCAVLGVTILNIDNVYTYGESLVNAAGAGIGFLLAMVLFAGIRQKIDEATNIPSALKGVPAILIAASILSMAFMGFSGMVDGLFG